MELIGTVDWQPWKMRSYLPIHLFIFQAWIQDFVGGDVLSLTSLVFFQVGFSIVFVLFFSKLIQFVFSLWMPNVVQRPLQWKSPKTSYLPLFSLGYLCFLCHIKHLPFGVWNKVYWQHSCKAGKLVVLLPAVISVKSSFAWTRRLV